ncbi:MAG: twin-arginine translocation pathway signal protein [Armatimonadota bacterium]
MDHDDAPIGTIYSRREALALAAKAGLGLTAGGLFTLASAQDPKPKVNLVASPALTEGPFFVDEKLNRSNLLLGTSREAVTKGLPLDLELTIYKMTGEKLKPFTNAQIDIWQCDAKGVYSDENHPMNHEDTKDQKWLRGYQVTDAKGVAKFQTIVPGWYPGRTAHIHFKVRTFSEKHQVTADFTSQLFFHESDLKAIYAKAPYSGQEVPKGLNMQDGIFSERQLDGTVAGEHLLLDLSPSKLGRTSKFAIVLSDKTFKAQIGPNSWDMF